MLSLPAIERELRVTARQPVTYNLRLLGVLVSVGVSALFGLNYGFEPALGGRLFAYLHLTLFVAIWILVPLLTADCISRERREGTLGLLFLTRLTGTEIVLAKGMAHGLRALTLWLAVLPVLTISFLLGGVGWVEASLSVLINFSALCWALVAGLLASAGATAWHRALIRATILAGLSFCLLALTVGWLLIPALRPGLGSPWQTGFTYPWFIGMAFLVNSIMDTWLRYAFSVAPRQLLLPVGEVAAISLLALALAILLAGAWTRRAFQDEPPSPFKLWLQATFCTPVLWRSFLRRWMRWKLERNPVGWLEQRTWSGRLVTWGWLAVIVSLYSAAVTDHSFFRSYAAIQRLIAWLLAGSIALCAAGSFRRERASGVLELLLVSPLGEWQIIWGRLRGLWGQFLLANCLILAIWVWFANSFPGEPQEQHPVILFYAVTFLTLPAVGLYYSLDRPNLIAAFLATLAVGLFLPIAAPAIVAWIWWLAHYTGTSVFLSAPSNLSRWATGCQVLIAAACLLRLHRRLRRRAFKFDRTGA